MTASKKPIAELVTDALQNKHQDNFKNKASAQKEFVDKMVREGVFEKQSYRAVNTGELPRDAGKEINIKWRIKLA